MSFFNLLKFFSEFLSYFVNKNSFSSPTVKIIRKELFQLKPTANKLFLNLSSKCFSLDQRSKRAFSLTAKKFYLRLKHLMTLGGI
jgi:hypothetical protein